MPKPCLLTIFTPTYNRATELYRLYGSLLKQTDYHFEWIIVDDGSTDDTADYVARWEQCAPFEITLYRQENAGKHVAHNRGAAYARGTYFICVDSDDWLEPDAVETIRNDSQLLSESEGLIYPKLFESQDSIDLWFDGDNKVIRLSDMRMQYGMVVETAIVFKTDVLRRHPFPVIEGEKFIPEESSYYDFDRSEVFLVRDNPFYRCEYLKEGLTKNIWHNWFNNPIGTRLALSKRIELSSCYRGRFGIREKIAAIAGIESLNIARHERLFEGMSFSWLCLAVLPIACVLRDVRFGYDDN